ncbi:DUF6773 family protein [Clostridium minihomine]|uniref:DUF6773 family protein n=1 Tax=Clostridium minihomine TaxID=2045012 RepID=UPI000C7934CA|nr:DUF6773 family protein [Clostridium minihomine]
MGKKSNQLDEMQELKLLKIEKNGLRLAFYGLLIVIFLQIILGMGRIDMLRNIAGELVVFLCLCIYLVAGCIKNGIWDRNLKPNLKTNLIVSLIGSFISGIIILVGNWCIYRTLWSAFLSGFGTFLCTFVLSFAAVSIAARLYKKRAAILEQGHEDQPIQ